MILEEMIVFDSEEDANTFCTFVHGLGAQVKKTFRGIAFIEDIVTCSLNGYIDWLSEMIKSTSEEDDPYSVDEIQRFEKHLNLLKRTDGKLRDILSGKEIGDIIYTRETVQKAILSLLALPNEEKAQSLFQSPEDNDVWIPIDIMLRDNHVVVESPEGYRLDRIIDPGDLLYQNTPASESDAYKKAGASHGCSYSANHSIDPECVVISGPALYLCDRENKITDLLDTLSVDESSLDLFYQNYYTKRQILFSLIDLVTGSGVISLDTLTKEMTGFSWLDEDGKPGFSINLSPVMTKTIVDELMKAKILSGTEKKIRIGKTIRGRA